MNIVKLCDAAGECGRGLATSAEVMRDLSVADTAISAMKKLKNTITEPVRALVHQAVTSTGYLDQIRAGDPLMQDTGVPGRDDLIIGPGDNQCWRTNFPKAGE